jgi:hypothetical protein
LIALLFALWGGWVLATPRDFRLRRTDALLFVTGALSALAAFLAPAWQLLGGDATALRDWIPGSFLWPLYLVGLAVMAAALLRVVRVR